MQGWRCNVLSLNEIRKTLIFGVFATLREVVCKYAKYKEVCCQENSVILTAMILIRSTHMSFDRKVTFKWVFQCVSPCNYTNDQSQRFYDCCVKGTRFITFRRLLTGLKIKCHTEWKTGLVHGSPTFKCVSKIIPCSILWFLHTVPQFIGVFRFSVVIIEICLERHALFVGPRQGEPCAV